MRIVQVIDSLEVGGAERMAINFANALSTRIEFSGLISTRAEGELKSQLDIAHGYLFLNKKSTLDLSAVLRMKAYCKSNKIDIIHAHSSSYFMAVLVKILYPRIAIIWHDHYGMSEFLKSRKTMPLKLASIFFTGIIAVNRKLEQWAKDHFNCRNIIYIANFTMVENPSDEATKLKGISGKRILCLANLREQKNHWMLLAVAEKFLESHKEWTFHLVGKDFEDDYSARLKLAIAEKKLSQNVFIYGSKKDTPSIIQKSGIAILTSRSEGLPVSLLEYGLYRKPVVATNVGEIPEIVINGKNGYLVAVDDVDAFCDSLSKLADSEKIRDEFGDSLYQTISFKHSEEAAMNVYLKWVKNLKHD